MTNSPVNHVAMTAAVDDLPPLLWHAELGDNLTDMWTGTNQQGVQLNDARAAVEQWIHRYGQRCWLRQLTPYANREQENRLLRVIARMDGMPFPSTVRLAGRWLRGRLEQPSDIVRLNPLSHAMFGEFAELRKAVLHRVDLDTVYCAETVAITYEEMGLLSTYKHSTGFDPGSFWSGDRLPLAKSYVLGTEIAVTAD